MTINSNFDVARVTFTASGLNFDYNSSGPEASRCRGRLGSVEGSTGLTAVFGDGDTPGLVITGGDLVSLDMTINATFNVAAVAFNATNLNFAYMAATGGIPFRWRARVGVTIAGIGRPLGHLRRSKNANPVTDPADYYGLIIQNDQLQSLNMLLGAVRRGGRRV